MRTLVALLATAFPLLAQSAITLQVDVQPPPSDSPSAGNWVTFDGTPQGVEALSEFRLRALGTEGGWYAPVLSVQVDPTASGVLPNWLSGGQSCLGSQLDLHGVTLQSGANTTIWRQGPFQRMFALTLMGGTASIQSLAVRSWAQPFLTQSPYLGQTGLHASTRLWSVAAPLWATGQGQVNKSLWTSVLQDVAVGATPPRQSVLSAPAALRQAILLQALYSGTNNATQALDFLSSPQFTTAVENGWLRLVVQMYSLRAPTMPDIDFPDDLDVLGLGNLVAPPIGAISHPALWVVMFPYQASNGWVQNWPGTTIVPGQVFYFDNAIATPPVQLSFHTTTGVTVVDAYSAATLFSPSRWGVVVPTNAVSGMVAMKCARDAAFADVAPLDVSQYQGH